MANMATPLGGKQHHSMLHVLVCSKIPSSSPRTANGITYKQTANHVFIPGAYAEVLGVTKDQCHGTDVVPTITGEKQVSFVPSTSKAATQGKYDNKAYRGTAIK